MRLLLLLASQWLIACGSHQTKPIDCGQFLASERDVMASLDENRNGSIDRAEWEKLQAAMVEEVRETDRKYNSVSNPREITESFAEFDANTDGRITFVELTKGVCSDGNLR